MLYPDINDDEFDLTIYVPSKGRPDNAKRLQEQFYRTTKLMTRLVIINSDNDQHLDRYTGIEYSITVSPDKPGFVSPLNLGYLADRNTYSYAVGFMGDDHFPRTEGWDEILVQELLAMKAGFAYGDDGLQGILIPTQVVMTSDIPKCLGFMTLPQLKHLYADDFWRDFGMALDRIKYVPEVLIEHLHPAAGKANYDAGYEFSGSASLDREDKAAYTRYLENGILQDVEKVKAMLRRTRKL